MMRRGVWFGTRDYARWIPAPSISGYSAASVGWSSKSIFLNGRAAVRKSHGSHREYAMSWSNKSQAEVLPILDFAHGLHGDGLIYWSDPFAEQTNILPKDWATPQVAAEGRDGVNVCGGTRRPTLVPASPGRYGFLAQSVDMAPFPAGSAPTVLLQTNLATNPSFERAGSAVTLRTNLLTNPVGPNAPLVTTGWRGPGGDELSVVSDEGSPAIQLRELSPAAAGTYLDSANYTATVGQTIRFAADVKTNDAMLAAGMRMRVLGYNGGVVSGGAAMSPIPVNEFLRISGEAVVTAAPDGAYFRALVWPADTAESTASWIRTRRGVVEIGTDLPADDGFFDGATAAGNDRTYAWTGAAHASTSTQNAVGVGSVQGGGGRAAIQSTAWAASGATSLRIISNAAPTGANGAAVFTPTPGKTYTVSARLRMTAASATSASTARRIFLLSGEQSEQAPNAAGTHLVTFTFTAPAEATTVRLGQGAPGESVWWDELLIVEGDQAVDYFDGSTPMRDGHTFAWTGTANASTSTERGFKAPINLDAKRATILIPPNRDLIMRAYGTETGGQYRYAVQQKGRAPVLVPWSSTTDINSATGLRRFSGGVDGSYVDVYLSADSPSARATIAGAMAQIVPTGSTPVWQQFFTGQGAAGCAFDGLPMLTPYSAPLDMVGLTASLIEVGP